MFSGKAWNASCAALMVVKILKAQIDPGRYESEQISGQG